MADETKSSENPEELLDSLGNTLKGREGVDIGLAEILTTHILKATPAQNAVAQAKDAIVKLAQGRANPPKPEVANG